MLQAVSSMGVYSFPIANYRKFESESAIVAGFADRINALGRLAHPSPVIQARIFDEVRRIARRMDMSREKGSSAEFVRRVLYEDTRWSLAAIILRPGQDIYAHDHGGWGCAVTVHGIERDRRFRHDEQGKLMLASERDYSAGMGYMFDPEDVHQPVGAHPHRATVALHFLVLEGQKHKD